MNITDLIVQLGISTPQGETFLALRQFPEGVSIVDLSKKMAVARPTLYGHLGALIDHGLASPIVTRHGKLFIAESTDRIQELFDERIQQLVESKNSFASLAKKIPKIEYYKPRFSVFESTESAERIFRDILRSREKETYWLWPVEEMIGAIPESVLAAFHKERIARGIWLNVLWPHGQTEQGRDYSFLKGTPTQKTFLRRARTLPKDLQQHIGYGIYGNRVAFLSARREHYGLIVESAELHQTLKSQFDYFWKIGKPYTS
ncbi:hypothetical protein HON52_00380 [Candidatus Uhrbacteria bacterium]|jgi:HTH-type transcriptional regulator, sugar sensing transcriptional regulator|nr:hypothetical protein [Candidatus Uhrbacteria bacterium]